MLAYLFWDFAAMESTILRIEYVREKSNDADAPHRWCTSSCESGFNRRAGDLPNALSVAFPPCGSIYRESTASNKAKMN